MFNAKINDNLFRVKNRMIIYEGYFIAARNNGNLPFQFALGAFNWITDIKQLISGIMQLI